MEYPDTIRPTKCPRCGWLDLDYDVMNITGFEKDSNMIEIPVRCINHKCGIKFFVKYRFNDWSPM